MSILDRILRADVTPLSSLHPGLDPEVIRIVQRAMMPDAAERYQDLARMRNELSGPSKS